MENSPPPLFRLLEWLGKPFGYYYIPENHARLIRRMEQYHHVHRGPGFRRINTLMETLGPLVKTGVEAFSHQFDNLPTRDGLQLGLRFAINYTFDPEKTKLTTAAKFANMPREVFCEIIANRMRRALLSILAACSAEEVCRGQVFDNIERQLLENANQLLAFLGITISSALALQVIPPEKLRARFEGVAQRRISIEATRDYQSSDVNRALAAELIEGIADHGVSADHASFNFNEMLNSPEQEQRTFLSPPKKKK